ncbi:MAG: 30S ribosomal protein S6 [Anaerolineae bacterium]|nr:30S ribosomal protein S6 [Anaerolineae bacterium]
MHDYELTLIIAPRVDQEGVDAILDAIKQFVEVDGGTLNSVKPWGLRRLAYAIKDMGEGQYVFIELRMPPHKVAPLERTLKLNESVLRHLFVRTDEE